MVRWVRIGIVYHNCGWLAGGEGQRASGSDRVRAGAEGITEKRSAGKEDIGSGHIDGSRCILSDEKSRTNLGGKRSRDIKLEQVSAGEIGIPSVRIDG